MSLESAALILLSRSPAAGPVKTRLAQATSFDFAQSLYSLFLQDLGQTLLKLNLPVFVFYTPDTSLAKANLRELLGPEPIYQPQGEGSLEERMTRAFEHCFAQGFERLALIGGDLPDLPVSYVQSAFDALLDHDWVLGPTRDGGYYLVGARAECFDAAMLDWSQMPPDHIYLQTVAKLTARQQRLFSLPDWQDVDTLDDLNDLVARHADSSLTGPLRTLNYLRQTPWPNQ